MPPLYSATFGMSSMDHTTEDHALFLSDATSESVARKSQWSDTHAKAPATKTKLDNPHKLTNRVITSEKHDNNNTNDDVAASDTSLPSHNSTTLYNSSDEDGQDGSYARRPGLSPSGSVVATTAQQHTQPPPYTLASSSLLLEANDGGGGVARSHTHATPTASQTTWKETAPSTRSSLVSTNITPHGMRHEVGQDVRPEPHDDAGGGSTSNDTRAAGEHRIDTETSQTPPTRWAWQTTLPHTQPSVNAASRSAHHTTSSIAPVPSRIESTTSANATTATTLGNDCTDARAHRESCETTNHRHQRNANKPTPCDRVCGSDATKTPRSGSDTPPPQTQPASKESMLVQALYTDRSRRTRARMRDTDTDDEKEEEEEGTLYADTTTARDDAVESTHPPSPPHTPSHTYTQPHRHPHRIASAVGRHDTKNHDEKSRRPRLLATGLSTEDAHPPPHRMDNTRSRDEYVANTPKPHGSEHTRSPTQTDRRAGVHHRPTSAHENEPVLDGGSILPYSSSALYHPPLPLPPPPTAHSHPNSISRSTLLCLREPSVRSASGSHSRSPNRAERYAEVRAMLLGAERELAERRRVCGQLRAELQATESTLRRESTQSRQARERWATELATVRGEHAEQVRQLREQLSVLKRLNESAMREKQAGESEFDRRKGELLSLLDHERGETRAVMAEYRTQTELLITEQAKELSALHVKLRTLQTECESLSAQYASVCAARERLAGELEQSRQQHRECEMDYRDAEQSWQVRVEQLEAKQTALQREHHRHMAEQQRAQEGVARTIRADAEQRCAELHEHAAAAERAAHAQQHRASEERIAALTESLARWRGEAEEAARRSETRCGEMESAHRAREAQRQSRLDALQAELSLAHERQQEGELALQVAHERVEQLKEALEDVRGELTRVAALGVRRAEERDSACEQVQRELALCQADAESWRGRAAALEAEKVSLESALAEKCASVTQWRHRVEQSRVAWAEMRRALLHAQAQHAQAVCAEAQGRAALREGEAEVAALRDGRARLEEQLSEKHAETLRRCRSVERAAKEELQRGQSELVAVRGSAEQLRAELRQAREWVAACEERAQAAREETGAVRRAMAAREEDWQAQLHDQAESQDQVIQRLHDLMNDLRGELVKAEAMCEQYQQELSEVHCHAEDQRADWELALTASEAARCKLDEDARYREQVNQELQSTIQLLTARTKAYEEDVRRLQTEVIDANHKLQDAYTRMGRQEANIGQLSVKLRAFEARIDDGM